MKPLGGRVLLKRPPIAEKVGSIHIPDKFRGIPQEGTVIAVGHGPVHTCSACGHTEHRTPTVEVGQQVLHGRYSRMGLPGYGDDLYLVWEQDVMCVLDPDDKHD
jgi:co-chaperonin GroES (HSP10)